MTEKPWLKHYDAGVPASLNPYPVQPLFAFLTESARRYPDSPAILSSAHLPVLGRQKRTVSYRELDSQSDALAAALVDLNVRKGDSVAIVMPNCTQFVIAFYAILKAGGVV